jgi:hypothetical protein
MLTDEQVTAIWESKKFMGELYIDYIAFARAIETAVAMQDARDGKTEPWTEAQEK